jgi:hypothetical protein
MVNQARGEAGLFLPTPIPLVPFPVHRERDDTTGYNSANLNKIRFVKYSFLKNPFFTNLFCSWNSYKVFVIRLRQISFDSLLDILSYSRHLAAICSWCILLLMSWGRKISLLSLFAKEG